jgi:hypothetical protein
MMFKISPLNQDRIIFAFYIALIAIPFVVTLGLPLPVSSLSRTFYNTIEEIPEGGVVLWVTDISFPLWVEIGSGEIAIFKHLFKLAQERKIKLIFATTYSADGAVLSDMIIRDHIIPGGFAKGLKYGEDWVQLGWLPGWETSLAALVRDIHKVARADYFGTPIEQIPMMKNIKSVKDLSLLGWSGYYVDEYARQWTGFGKPIIVNLSATTVAMAKPWFEKGLLTTYLNGQRGCAEYEALTGFKGFATSAMDAQSMAHLFAIILLIVPNIFYLSTRFRKRR